MVPEFAVLIALALDEWSGRVNVNDETFTIDETDQQIVSAFSGMLKDFAREYQDDLIEDLTNDTVNGIENFLKDK
jgi:hypothetical protein